MSLPDASPFRLVPVSTFNDVMAEYKPENEGALYLDGNELKVFPQTYDACKDMKVFEGLPLITTAVCDAILLLKDHVDERIELSIEKSRVCIDDEVVEPPDEPGLIRDAFELARCAANVINFHNVLHGDLPRIPDIQSKFLCGLIQQAFESGQRHTRMMDRISGVETDVAIRKEAETQLRKGNTKATEEQFEDAYDEVVQKGPYDTKKAMNLAIQKELESKGIKMKIGPIQKRRRHLEKNQKT